jgi:hypothetical protein
MPYSTCCGAHTTMPEYDICPDCREHCDWEDDDDETITHQATLIQDEIRYESNKHKPDDYDRPE